MCVKSNYQHFGICLTSFALTAGAEHPVKSKGKIAEEKVGGGKIYLTLRLMLLCYRSR